MEVEPAAAHDRYGAALSRAGRFLRGRQRRDGSTAGAGSIWGYYSQPLGLLSGGSPEDWSCANRCLDFVLREHLTAAGTVGVEPLPYVGDLYVSPYLIRGAATWGRTDLSVPLARSLARFQDPCGGIRYRIQAPGLIDPATTAHGGIALLATGHLQHAQRAGRFLLRLHRVQRDLADRIVDAQQADGGFFSGTSPATSTKRPGSGPMRSAGTRSCRPILISSSTPPRRWLITWRRYGPSSEE